ncbi:hypothetical protein D3C73_995410 [compost metagenome]
MAKGLVRKLNKKTVDRDLNSILKANEAYLEDCKGLSIEPAAVFQTESLEACLQNPRKDEIIEEWNEYITKLRKLREEAYRMDYNFGIMFKL